jgi:adenylate kinase family enzyme
MSNELPVGSRIAVVGVSGSGKTQAANRLSDLLGYPYIELDSIHWLPGWQEMPRPDMRQKLAKLVKSPTWVIDGNYSYLRDIIWKHADTLIWLDYPLHLILWRLSKRTFRRAATREVLWNGNREDFMQAFIGRESLFQWALHSYGTHHKTYPLTLAEAQYSHLRVYRFRMPSQFEILIQTIIAITVKNK